MAIITEFVLHPCTFLCSTCSRRSGGGGGAGRDPGCAGGAVALWSVPWESRGQIRNVKSPR